MAIKSDGLPWRMWIGLAQHNEAFGSIYLKIPKWVEADLQSRNMKKREKIGVPIIHWQLETYKEIWES